MRNYEPQGAQLRAFCHSNGFLRALIGPIYGGRKSACVNDIARRATDRRLARQRLWRWLVVAPERRHLERATIPAIKTWLDVGDYDDKLRHFGLKYRLEDGVERLLELEFVGMDDVGDRRRFLATPVTGVWLDDARNLSETVLEDAIRIAGTWPTPLHGGAVWAGVICSSRMPPPGHWLVRRNEDPGDLVLFRQPGGRAEGAENLPALTQRGFSYEACARERDPDWIRIHIDAELGHSASEAAVETERRAAREHLSRWVPLAMPDITPARHHRLLIEKLEALASGRIKRLMFFLPPGAAKSTYGSVLFPSWYLGNHPTHSVIAASHSKELAERFGRRVRNIVGSPIFGETFGSGLSGDSGAAGPLGGANTTPSASTPRLPAGAATWRSSTTRSRDAKRPTAPRCGSMYGIGTRRTSGPSDPRRGDALYRHALARGRSRRAAARGGQDRRRTVGGGQSAGRG